MKYKFMAPGVEILRFGTTDKKGFGLLDAAVVDFNLACKVLYGPTGYEVTVGHAKLRRERHAIVADLSLYCRATDEAKAFRRIQKLYPAVELDVHGSDNGNHTNVAITSLFLTPYPNNDAAIAPIGDRLSRKVAPNSLN